MQYSFNSSRGSYNLIDQVHCAISSFTSTFFVSIICITVKWCVPAFRVLQVEQIFNNKVVMDNLLAAYGHSPSSLSTVLCQQEKCECFGFNSVTQICRVHSFCRPDNTIVNESGWKYYRTSKYRCYSFFFCLLHIFSTQIYFSWKCFYQLWLFHIMYHCYISLCIKSKYSCKIVHRSNGWKK